MQRKRYIAATISLTIFLLLYLFKPYPYSEAPGEPIYFTTSNGTLLNIIAPTVLLDGSHSKAEYFGIRLYNLIPPNIIKKIIPPGVSKDQLIPRENAIFVTKSLFPENQIVKMVHPSNVIGDSSSLAWGLASVIAGDSSISVNGLIAATGTLWPGGQVGVVGGVATKAKSVHVAKTFLTFAPSTQINTVLETFQISNSVSIPIGISNIQQAVGVLCIISLSDSKTCSQYLTQSPKTIASEGFLTVRLPPSNMSLCDLLRHSENKELNTIVCTKVFDEGFWYIELSTLTSTDNPVLR
jgi:hypothetical protein